MTYTTPAIVSTCVLDAGLEKVIYSAKRGDDEM